MRQHWISEAPASVIGSDISLWEMIAYNETHNLIHLSKLLLWFASGSWPNHVTHAPT